VKQPFALFFQARQKLQEQRAIIARPQLEVLFTLISNTGMRLQEAYLLRVSDLDFKNFVAHVQGSKGCMVSSSTATPSFAKWCVSHCKAHIKANHLENDDYLFREGWWDGDCMSLHKPERKIARKKTSSYLSGLFRALYKAADVQGLTEHDLRHEATIRYIEMEQNDKAIYNRED